MALHWKILIAMITGVVWALISENFLFLNSFNTNWLAPFGDIFMSLLKLIAVPLVLFSIIILIYFLPNNYSSKISILYLHNLKFSITSLNYFRDFIEDLYRIAF